MSGQESEGERFERMAAQLAQELHGLADAEVKVSSMIYSKVEEKMKAPYDLEPTIELRKENSKLNIETWERMLQSLEPRERQAFECAYWEVMESFTYGHYYAVFSLLRSRGK